MYTVWRCELACCKVTLSVAVVGAFAFVPAALYTQKGSNSGATHGFAGWLTESLGSDPSALPRRMLLNVGEIRSRRTALVSRTRKPFARESRGFLKPVFMMEAAENRTAPYHVTRWNRVSVPCGRRRRTGRRRDSGPETHVWPGLVEVRHPRFENSPEMTFVERNQKVPGTRAAGCLRIVRRLNLPGASAPVFAIPAHPWRPPVCPVLAKRCYPGRGSRIDMDGHLGAPRETAGGSTPPSGAW